MSAGVLEDGTRVQVAHSWEAAVVLTEVKLREIFAALFRWKLVPVKIYLPSIQYAGFPGITEMPYLLAIAFDTSVDGSTSGTNTLSWSHTVTGSDPLGAVSLFQNNSADDITCTFNGVSMTKAGTAQQSSDTNKMSLFYLAGAATGTVAGTGNGSTSYMEGKSASYSGAPGGFDSSASNSPAAGTSLTLTTTVVDTDCWVVSCCRTDGFLATPTTGTRRQPGSGGTVTIGDSNAAVGTGSQSMTWTHTSGNQGGVIMSISPTGDAPATVFPSRGFSLLGVGQ